MGKKTGTTATTSPGVFKLWAFAVDPLQSLVCRANRPILKIQKINQTFAKTFRSMPLRYNRILKLFAIILFLTELLAPSVLLASPEGNAESTSANQKVSEPHASIDFIYLLFEEPNNENKEGKEEVVLPVIVTEVFSSLQKFYTVRQAPLLPFEQFDIGPALFTLHRVLLI
jgi:hypothetical protein